MSEDHVTTPADPSDLEAQLRDAREELELLRFRLHSVEVAFYEHELRYTKAKRQLQSPLYRVYAGTYRLLLRPIRPFAVKAFRFAKRSKRYIDRARHR